MKFNLLFLFIFILGNAQNEVNFVVYTERTHIQNQSKVSDHVLMHNQKEAYYFIISKFSENSINSQQFKTKDPTEGAEELYYKNLDSASIYTTRYDYYGQKYHMIKDDYSINWKITKGKSKKILNYDCELAEADFRGRKWQVWFAKDIPISTGPWKLHGLPGLILEAKDIDGIFNYSAKEIVLNFSHPIRKSVQDFFNKNLPKAKPITFWVDLDRINKKKILEQVKATLPNGTNISEISDNLNQADMEISYEWETSPANF
ncbi:GLPGLI family protein [Amniculibacterium aquaticum]|uniref:GLPGLI family protein n=1 Tax=Amniculibacterium aquaticum TaxID=2479858 RepID=UPI000F59CD49|nr:GLPGLI family protein [Amniculibacterium aquaticum]